MKFTESELKVIYKYSAENKAETLSRLEKVISEL